MKVNRIKTYVKGLDKNLDGGIPVGSMVIIAGKPGTMKSSLAFNVLYHNAVREKRNCVYVSLEQGRESLLANMKGLGMSLGPGNDELSVLDLGMIRKKLAHMTSQTWMEVFKMYVKNLKANMGIDLLVIDSLAVLELIAKLQDPREELFHVFQWLMDMEVTGLIVTEMTPGSDEFCRYGEDFLADGIFHLDLRREGNSVNLYLSVLKMRLTEHKRSYFPLIYDKDGFEIVVE
jgi:circadian clock protein KaiC